MKIILAGGTGFVGSALMPELCARGHEVMLLTRHPERHKPQACISSIHALTGLADNAGEIFDRADAVVNLAGEPVIKRWSDEQKKRILESRVDITRAIVQGLAKTKKKPSVLVNSSAVGYYGPGSTPVDEGAPRGRGFLADVCEQWEAQALGAESHGVRTVVVRTPVVLGTQGGALKQMLPPFRFFAGGPVGSGEQYFPWVHVRDLVEIILFALNNPSVQGAVNAAAPEAVTMNQFAKTLGRVLHRPSWARVPEPVVRLLLGEGAEVLLSGQNVVPHKLEHSGFLFHYPKLEPALRNLLKGKP